MKELNRQVVIFGDFNAINFEIQSKIPDVIAQLNLSLEGAPDFFLPNVPIPGNNTNIPKLRPILKSYDVENQFSIFIGTKRFHIEQINTDVESFDGFISQSLSIIRQILDLYPEVKMDRIAVNGRLLQDDQSVMDRVYQETFKPSLKYGEMSDEYSYRINTRITSATLKSSINKIISYIRTEETIMGQKIPVLIIEYDYNTVTNPSRRFELSDLIILSQEVKAFRNLLV